MNPNRLRDTLSLHDADPDAVLARLSARRRTRDRRRRLLGSLAAVTLVVGGATVWSAVNRTSSGTSSPLAGPTTVSGSQPSGGADSGFAASGACLKLRDNIVSAPREGLSVITATGTLTERTGLDGYRYREMVLTDVRTLAGPPVADGARAWTLVPERAANPDPEIVDGGPDGPLWGPGGALLGIYAPQAVNRGPLGATIRHVPIVGDDVIMLSTGCWNSFTAQDVASKPYRGVLTEVPGSGTYAPLAKRGFVAVPLRTVEGFVTR